MNQNEEIKKIKEIEKVKKWVSEKDDLIYVD